MKIELLTIGEEILKGNTWNSNTFYLSKRLTEMGYQVCYQQTVADKLEDILSAIDLALSRSDYLIATGGLGPTLDDVTQEAVCHYFSSSLKFYEEIYQNLTTRFALQEALKKQATLPEKAEILMNEIGTACGLVFSLGEKKAIFLPGVPWEMQDMVEKKVFPVLEKQKEAPVAVKSYHFCFLKEIEIDPFLREIHSKYPEVEIGIYPSLFLVHVFFSLQGKGKMAAQKKLTEITRPLEEKWKDHLYSQKAPEMEKALQEICLTKKKTLALAESCTGGAMAASLTAIPNASQFFVGSLVTYSNAWKETFLGVSFSTLQKKGAASKETVQQMLEGVFYRTQADLGIAVSGIAGPLGGSLEKPVGTVFLALGDREKKWVGKIQLKGKRKQIIQATCHFAFASLWRYLKHQLPPPFV